MEALNKLLSRAKELELFKGLKVSRYDHIEKIMHIFFADNTSVPVNQKREQCSTSDTSYYVPKRFQDLLLT